MHPAESYLLTDPRAYWRAARIYDQYYHHHDWNKSSIFTRQGVPADEMAVAGQLAHSFLTILPTDQEASLRAEQRRQVGGSPLDPKTQRSSARVFYQLLRHKGAWVYTYSLFYAWNGCANLAFTTRAGPAHTPHTLEYIACPDSTHECDWERVSVVVCPNKRGGHVVAALLSQHNHNQLLNCQHSTSGSTGDCTFRSGDDGHQHLSVYSALHSHANLPGPSNATICGQVSNGEDGVYFVDRAADGGPLFMPNTSNVLPLPGSGISKDSDPEDWAWSHYPGWWGAAEWKLPGPSITCLSADRVHKAACPDSPPWRLLATQTGISVAGRQPPSLQSVVLQPYLHLPADPDARMPYDYHVKGGAKQGPLFRPWAFRWEGVRNPPLWELPVAHALFRIVLNGGQRAPSLTCFTPQQEDGEQPQSWEEVVQNSPASISMNPWGSFMIIMILPFTLVPAMVLHHVLHVISLDSQPSGSVIADAADDLAHVSLGDPPLPSHLSNPVQGLAKVIIDAVKQRGGHHGGPSSSAGYSPVSGEIELGIGSGFSNNNSSSNDNDNGSRSNRKSTTNVSSDGHGYSSGAMLRNSATASNISPATSPLGVQSGSATHGSGRAGAVGGRLICGGTTVAGVRQRVVRALPALIVCAAAAMYVVGISRAFTVLRATLFIAWPVFSAIQHVLVLSAVCLMLRDLLVLLFPPATQQQQQPTLLMSRPPAARHRQTDTWSAAAAERNGLDADADADESSVITLGGPRGPTGTLTSLTNRAGRRQACHTLVKVVWSGLQLSGPLLVVVLLVSAVVLVAVQAIAQGVCQELVFSKVSLHPAFTAAGVVGPGRPKPMQPVGIQDGLSDLPDHWELLEDTAAVLSPVGAVNGADGPGRLYASSLCIRWRYDYGAGLLMSGAVIWAALHLLLRPGGNLHR